MALEAGTRFVAKTEEGGAAYDALREHAAREDHRQRQLEAARTAEVRSWDTRPVLGRIASAGV